MANDILLFRARRVLGRTTQRWPSLGRRALLAADELAVGLAVSQFGLERGVRLAGDLWGWARHQTLGKVPATDGALSRAMPVCRGAVRRNCVIDGDTVWVDGEKIRLSGIDAPEI
jgi:endonuclease YncB( thermonuclease family)